MSDFQPAPDAITVFWRPGCGFCRSLMAGIARMGLVTTEVNIWDEPDAAAFVRSVARGYETVPTVAVGPVALVNPSPRELLAAVEQHLPALVPTGS